MVRCLVAFHIPFQIGVAKSRFVKPCVKISKVGSEGCLDWLEQTASAKVHGTTELVPAEVFQEERESLRPLPACDQVKCPVICRTVR